jgi:hypothetical protein
LEEEFTESEVRAEIQDIAAEKAGKKVRWEEIKAWQQQITSFCSMPSISICSTTQLLS